MTTETANSTQHPEDAAFESDTVSAFEALQQASKLAIELGAGHANYEEAEQQIGRLLILAFRAGGNGRIHLPSAK